MIPHLLIALLCARAAFAQGCDLKPLLESRIRHVTTAYPDQGASRGQEQVSFHGAGFIIEVPMPGPPPSVQSLLVTDSHMADGRFVQSRGLALDRRNAIIDVRADLALIPIVTQSVAALGIYSGESRQVEATDAVSACLKEQLSRRSSRLLPADSRRGSFVPVPPSFQLGGAEPDDRVAAQSASPDEPDFWLQPGPAPLIAAEPPQWVGQPSAGMITVPARLRRGMSGLPLLGPARDQSRKEIPGRYQIAGVFQSPYLPFKRSYFASSSRMVELIELWKQGVRGRTNSGGWHWANHAGLLHLEDDEGNSEINPISPPGGDSGPQPPAGEGGSRPPGGGSRPPGGGDGEPETPSPEQEAHPEAVYPRSGTRPGMTIRTRSGKEQVLGFRVGSRLPLFADVESFEVMRKLRDEGQPYELITARSDLGNLFRRRYLPDAPSSFVIQNPYTLKLGRRNPALFYDHGKIRIEFTPPGEQGPGSEVSFELDQHGALVGSPDGQYPRFIRVENRAGTRAYLIDLQELYFESADRISNRPEGSSDVGHLGAMTLFRGILIEHPERPDEFIRLAEQFHQDPAIEVREISGKGAEPGKHFWIPFEGKYLVPRSTAGVRSHCPEPQILLEKTETVGQLTGAVFEIVGKVDCSRYEPSFLLHPDYDPRETPVSYRDPEHEIHCADRARAQMPDSPAR